jgi:hypothetical protein
MAAAAAAGPKSSPRPGLSSLSLYNNYQNAIEVLEVAARKREKAAESTVLSGGKGSPVRRRKKVMDTVQASDRDAAMWDIRFARAEMDSGADTDSVGNPYDDDPAGRKRSRKALRQ